MLQRYFLQFLIFQ